MATMMNAVTMGLAVASKMNKMQKIRNFQKIVNVGTFYSFAFICFFHIRISYIFRKLMNLYGSRTLIIKKSGARAQNSMFESTLRTCDPFFAICESTLRTCDPHPSKSKLWTGPKQVKSYLNLIWSGAICAFVRGDSEYGIPVAIWEMVHNSKKHRQTKKLKFFDHPY
jgi:hypothetical protein